MADDKILDIAAHRRRLCPSCGRPTATEFRPFCSKRCRDVDLGRWFSGDYAVPAEEPDEFTEDSEGGRG